MDLDLRGELEALMTEIKKRQRHIEDQVFLISVLEHDGHNTVEQQAALKLERKQLALQMERQTKLLQKASSQT
ncbi:hypothetical protein [Bradyrhizobium sp. Gha]|uniref:hypothetical protein n=1 Tax=Bradyrhizobium sp. Gha TaxID=1855318 RepID=UPI0008F2EC63|nr:hypothetical protein [Bradyrhizobium sp. Gha]SFJ45882.1 hypothetical protein SAMN05216525_125119 [Bradyrhizobium sp. Gha]